MARNTSAGFMIAEFRKDSSHGLFMAPRRARAGVCRPVTSCAGPPTVAALLPQAVTVPRVLNLEGDNRHDGRHHDRPGQYRH